MVDTVGYSERFRFGFLGSGSVLPSILWAFGRNNQGTLQVHYDAFGRNNQGTLHSSGMVGLFVGYTKQTRIQVDLKVEWFISIPRIDKSRSGIKPDQTHQN